MVQGQGRMKAGLQGGEGEDLRSLPPTLQGCDSGITSSCAGPQEDAGKEQNDMEGIMGEIGDSQTHHFASHVHQPGTDQQKETRCSEGLQRWQPALLFLRMQAGHGAPGRARGGGQGSLGGGGRDRPVWRPAARAGVG